jgi:hypothetical protein
MAKHRAAVMAQAAALPTCSRSANRPLLRLQNYSEIDVVVGFVSVVGMMAFRQPFCTHSLDPIIANPDLVRS